MDSILVSAIVLSFLCFFTIHQTGATHFSIHEQLKLQKMLNESAIKTIITEYGDVYDCVDIYKQPSLDHPLLRNHTVKLKPSFVLDGFNGTHEEGTYPHIGLENGGCSEGYVPIRRIRKKDRGRIMSYLKKYPSSINPNSPHKHNWHFALAQTLKPGIPYRGARGLIGVYNPSVAKNQHSDAIVYVSHGRFEEHNVIHAGWSVFPAVYGDGQTRLYTLWTADNYQKTGCIDIQCRGFVQVNKELPLGYHIRPISTYGGSQFHVPISVVQDQMSGEWWLIASYDVVVGYWPKELFTGLVDYADEVGWGGRTFSPDSQSSPAMGSGHRSGEGYGKACFVQQMQYTQSGSGSFINADISHLVKHVDNPICYDLDWFLDDQNRCDMYFGGPGGNCGRPTLV